MEVFYRDGRVVTVAILRKIDLDAIDEGRVFKVVEFGNLLWPRLVPARPLRRPPSPRHRLPQKQQATPPQQRNYRAHYTIPNSEGVEGTEDYHLLLIDENGPHLFEEADSLPTLADVYAM